MSCTVLLLAMLGGLLAGCDNGDSADEPRPAQRAGEMGFEGADLSLVGDLVDLPDGRQIRPPLDWQLAAPQVLEEVRRQTPPVGGPFVTEMHEIWIAPEGDGMLIVSEIRPTAGGSSGSESASGGDADGSGIVEAVRSQFAGAARLHEETFITPGGVAVRQFRIEVEQPVSGWTVKLLLPPDGDGGRVQLDYFLPGQSLARHMQAVGTSISTIAEGEVGARGGMGGGEGED